LRDGDDGDGDDGHDGRDIRVPTMEQMKRETEAWAKKETRRSRQSIGN
jgi:hypothetical protein